MREIALAGKRTGVDDAIHIIRDPAAIAAAFACAVTVFTSGEGLVARNGDLRIFSAYRRVFPQAS